MIVKNPQLGPILGNTSSHTVKVWIKANNNEKTNIYAVIKVFNSNGIFFKHIEPISFSKTKYYNGSIVVQIHRPQELGEFEYQIGIIQYEGNLSDFNFDTLNWENIQSFPFPKNLSQENEINFLLGSCRHAGAGVNYPKDADKPFKSILQKHINNYDFNLFIGDQIYADLRDGDVWFPNQGAKTKKEYFKKYQEAYEQPNFRKLMAYKPSYMILDDHELWNNFNPLEDKQTKRYKAAMKAYLAHQASLSPEFYEGDILENTLSPKLYYNFTQGAYKFFVLDIRTQRDNNASPYAKMFSEEQENALFNWIEENESHPYPKFIISGVPLFPDVKGPMAESSDKWTGFSEHRIRILQRLEREYKFIFLSGDVHVSYVSSLNKKNETKAFTYNIVSSALNWPQIGMQWWHFKWKKRLKEFLEDKPKKDEDGYKSKFLGPSRKFIRRFFKTIPTNNYAIVNAKRNQVIVTYYKSHNGKRIGKPVIIDLD